MRWLSHVPWGLALIGAGTLSLAAPIGQPAAEVLAHVADYRSDSEGRWLEGRRRPRLAMDYRDLSEGDWLRSRHRRATS